MAESTSKDEDNMTTLLIQGRKYYISKKKLAMFTKNNTKVINMKDLKLKPLNVVDKKINVMSLFKEDVLFDSTKKDPGFLHGEYPNLLLKNRLHTVSKTNLTIATYLSKSGNLLIITSRNVAKLIGQTNYDVVFTALCSVIPQDLKLRAMLALLSFDKECNHTCCYQTANDGSEEKTLKTYKDISCQTESDGETDKLIKDVDFKRRRKRKITPFVVKENPETPQVKRTIIHPNIKDDVKKIFSEKKKSLPSLPDIDLDEDSNSSMISSLSFTNMSVCSEILDNQLRKMLNATDHTIKESTEVKKEPDSNEEPNPNMEELNSKIEQANSITEEPNSIMEEPNSNLEQPNLDIERPEIDYNNFIIQTWDGTKVMVPCKPEDQFHFTTPYILKHVTNEERRKLLWHQAFIDWKLCVERDENDNLPLHLAVMGSDVDLVRRQCLVLKTRSVSLDVKANGMTALEISIRQNSTPECTRILVQLGADPLRMYKEQQTALHLAAEAKEGHLRAVVDGLSERARAILTEHDELQFYEWESRSDGELASHLLLQTSFMFDNQGYSPLMLAAKVGNPDNVRALLEKSPGTVNTAMPNSGNTALYIAVAEICVHYGDKDNRKIPQDYENYLKTVEVLLQYGADPEMENSSGTKIGELLQEFNIPSVCKLIANKVTGRHFDDAMPSATDATAYMLLKNDRGEIIVDSTNKGTKKEKGKQNIAEDDCVDAIGETKEKRIRGPKKKVGVKSNKCEVEDLITANIDGKTECKGLRVFTKESHSAEGSSVGEGSTNFDNNSGKDKLEKTTKIVDYASNILIANLNKSQLESNTNDGKKTNMRLVRLAPRPEGGIPKIPKDKIPANAKLKTVPILLPMSMIMHKNTPVTELGSIVITPLTDKTVKNMPNSEGSVKIMPKADRNGKIMPNTDGNVKIIVNADGHVESMKNADGNVKIITKTDEIVKTTKRRASLIGFTESAASGSKKSFILKWD